MNRKESFEQFRLMQLQLRVAGPVLDYPITKLPNHPIPNRAITNPNPAAVHVDKKFTTLFVIHPRRSNQAPRKLSQIMPTYPQSAMMYTSDNLTLSPLKSAITTAASNPAILPTRLTAPS